MNQQPCCGLKFTTSLGTTAGAGWSGVLSPTCSLVTELNLGQTQLTRHSTEEKSNDSGSEHYAKESSDELHMETSDESVSSGSDKKTHKKDRRKQRERGGTSHSSSEEEAAKQTGERQGEKASSNDKGKDKEKKSKDKRKEKHAETSSDEDSDSFVQHEVIVENALTGKFQKKSHVEKVLRGVRPPKTAAAAAEWYQQATDWSSSHVMQVSLEVASNVAQACFFFLQGLLGGFSLLHIVLMYLPPLTVPSPRAFLAFPYELPPPMAINSNPSNDAGRTAGFLRFYSPLAMVVQHVMLFLTSTALLGACNKLVRDRTSAWYTHRFRQPVIDGTLILVYLIGFGFNLACLPADQALYYSEVRVPGWYGDDSLLSASGTRAVLRRWHAFSTVRDVACVLGWLVAGLVETLLAWGPPTAAGAAVAPTNTGEGGGADASVDHRPPSSPSEPEPGM
eukprot:TRINITY_DN2637_c0_g1_i2.p1 TRINITY_DN2637_c0_g1~~TRINITY_DN2637_c0_g1_i2.p1  ORF type:complete len:450 (-),score=102.81 TRINITY_DN2637_c0_g1_i2:36-1385(-)